MRNAITVAAALVVVVLLAGMASAGEVMTVASFDNLLSYEARQSRQQYVMFVMTFVQLRIAPKTPKPQSS
jgi:hypothetical protein